MGLAPFWIVHLRQMPHWCHLVLALWPRMQPLSHWVFISKQTQKWRVSCSVHLMKFQAAVHSVKVLQRQFSQTPEAGFCDSQPTSHKENPPSSWLFTQDHLGDGLKHQSQGKARGLVRVLHPITARVVSVFKFCFFRGVGGAEGERMRERREKLKQAPRPAWSPARDSISQPEPKSRVGSLTDWATQAACL